MENWKDKANKILDKYYNLDKDEDNNEIFYKWQVIEAMKEFAELACKEQKKIIANEVIKIQKPDHRKYISKKFILNTAIVKFE